MCAFGEVLAGCALKFAACIMTVSKGVVNGYVGYYGGVYKRNNVVRKKCIQYLGGVMVK